ncbi:MAG: hypothetical protein COY81_00265 [Candidatus Pacebacteria bacterium CG_4_10_14_0_8_um_filter_43_12]|nr:MAG: hypothetical protein COY81_00265 [Candidatus Pacebacteria bacterium CG_4_10_14_0_8_um_filter_43_12]
MIDQQIVLLTGATGTIGRQLLQHLLVKGYHVVATTRSQKNKQLLEKQFSTKNISILISDLTTSNASEQLVEELIQKQLKPSVLINCARDVKQLRAADEAIVPREKWITEYLLDVVVPYELSMLIATMPDSQLQTIVNISSIYGMVAQNPTLYAEPAKSLTNNYGAAKAALIQTTRDLAVQLAPKVRVNCVSFGGVRHHVPQSFINRYKKLTPQKRMLEKKDVIGPVLFLISPEAATITGHNLVADGGWTIW